MGQGWAIAAVLGLVAWIVAAALASGELPTVAQWLREPGNGLRAGLWAVATLVAASTLLAEEESWLANLQSEAIGIAVTVIVIDELQRRRAWQERKREIIEQMGSRSNDFALEGARLAKKHGLLRDGSLRKAPLTEVELQGADLQKADLQGATLWRAKLQEANLWRANLQEARMVRTNLQGTILQEANLQKAHLYEANLQGANLQEANLQGAILQEANLKGANLWRADLQGAVLERGSLQGAALWKANLQEADLREADLQGADLTGAYYSVNTKWPDGFDYVGAGVVLREKPNDGSNAEKRS